MHARSRHERPDPLIGTVLHNLRIEALIGEGSAAQVYRARHLFLDRLSAVKVLSTSNATTPGLEERFKREARALATMSHTNVVSVFDFGMTPDGRPFLAMELLAGRTLADVIARDGPLERSRIARIARQLAAGLAEAHRHQIVHRDLKPANIMLLGWGANETAKILDFGVARATGRSERALTGLEVIIGTPRYMAPEQVMNPSSVSPASDLYSLGVVLYEMLSGRAPFSGRMLEVLDQQMNHLPPPLATDTGLDRLVHQLLSKRPEDRPPSAEAVIRRLELIPDVGATQLDLLEVLPNTLMEEATVRDDYPAELDRETMLDGNEETLLPATAPGLVLVAPTTLLPQASEPQASIPSLVRPRRRTQRTATVLSIVALLFGCSMMALAAVSVQRRLEPQVVQAGRRPAMRAQQGAERVALGVQVDVDSTRAASRR